MPLRVAIDLDGTILRHKTDPAFDTEANTAPYSHFGEPMEGVKEALQTLRDAGVEIVITTSRLETAMVRSHLMNTLRLPFDRLVSQSNQLGYDVLVGARCVPFTGNWERALSELLGFLEHGTWEEKRLREQVTLGLPDQIKGML